jgi:formylglycine-generating enzyme
MPDPMRRWRIPMIDAPTSSEHGHGCCSPAAEHGADRRAEIDPSAGNTGSVRRGASDATAAAVGAAAKTIPDAAMVHLPGGEFRMGNPRGDGYPADGESPVHTVRLRPFWIDPTTVTNAAFARFADATGFVTESEQYGWSFVFGGLLPDDFEDTAAAAATPWWRQVFGADWRHPEGPQSSIDDRPDHPVVQVSWADAAAYAAWTGKRLPTEAEWEYAARGGLDGVAFPWGAEREPGGEHRMNVFQGLFPNDNTGADGYLGTAPVTAFPPNGFGLYATTGNVWEWCADWFAAGYYAVSPTDDPPGPAGGTHRVYRGGSYLCHDSYCYRYRVDSRSGSTPDSAAGNVGFRCVRDDVPRPGTVDA